MLPNKGQLLFNWPEASYKIHVLLDCFRTAWAFAPTCYRGASLTWTVAVTASSCFLLLPPACCGNDPEPTLPVCESVCCYWYSWCRIQVLLCFCFRGCNGWSSLSPITDCCVALQGATASPTINRPRAWLFRYWMNFWGSEILVCCRSVLEVSQSKFPLWHLLQD